MEANATIQTVSNWNRIGGCELYQCVKTRITHEDIFVKPDVNDIIHKENSILLNLIEGSTSSCELQLRLQPTLYKIEAISLVCTAPRLELFLGPLKEYIETIYGEIAEFDEDGEVFSYRYDIEVQKSGVVELMLKLLTTTVEVCIFGILVQIAPNPNGITTGNTINLDNVQQLLSGSAQKLSPSAEKCMLFMQAGSSQAPSQPINPVQATSALLSQMTQALGARDATFNWLNDANKNALQQQALSGSLENSLRAHIDQRFEELEQKIQQRFEKAIVQQNAKLDKILELLEKQEDDDL